MEAAKAVEGPIINAMDAIAARTRISQAAARGGRDAWVEQMHFGGQESLHSTLLRVRLRLAGLLALRDVK